MFDSIYRSHSIAPGPRLMDSWVDHLWTIILLLTGMISAYVPTLFLIHGNGFAKFPVFAIVVPMIVWSYGVGVIFGNRLSEYEISWNWKQNSAATLKVFVGEVLTVIYLCHIYVKM